MLTIGLTGGISSGKTTVANLFAKHGVTIIDTDQLSRDLTQPGQIALKKISEQLGPSVLTEEGSLNRAALRKIIFADESKRKWLEALLHPLIRTEMQRLIQLAQSPYCIVVIPLLVETAPNPLIDRILVVDTDREKQIERTELRDKISRENAIKIMDTQASREQRLAKADEVITNSDSLADIASQVNALHNRYLILSNAKQKGKLT